MWFWNPTCQNHLFYCSSLIPVAGSSMKGTNVGLGGLIGSSPAPLPRLLPSELCSHPCVCVYFDLGWGCWNGFKYF